jgi:hypothetical protein
MPRPETEQPKPKQESRHRLDYYLVYATIAAAVAATLAAGMTGWQAYLTRQYNVLSQRAAVSISLQAEYLSVEADGATPKAVNFLFLLANSGNTATHSLSLLVKCLPSAEDLQEPWSLLRQGPTPFGGNVPTFIGAHGSETSGCSFPFNQIIQMRDEKLFGYILVDISYFDRLERNVLHRSQKALKLWQVTVKTNVKPPAVEQVLVLGKHNCADEECTE